MAEMNSGLIGENQAVLAAHNAFVSSVQLGANQVLPRLTLKAGLSR
jgi:hypothetical protein